MPSHYDPYDESKVRRAARAAEEERQRIYRRDVYVREAEARKLARIDQEERERVIRRSRASERQREEWDNTSLGGKLVTIVVVLVLLGVGAKFLGGSPSSGESSLRDNSTIATAPDAPSDNGRSNAATYTVAPSATPRSEDATGGLTEPAASPEVAQPSPSVAAPERSVDQDLSILDQPTPRYPPQAARQRHEGTTIVQVTVNDRGTVDSVAVERSSGYRELDRAAMDAARRWTFNPAIHDGQPAGAVFRAPIHFNLSM